MTVRTRRQKEDQLYSYDDVDLYQYAIYKGRSAWVIGKGRDVSSTKGKHLKLQYEDEHPQEKTRELCIKSNLVNRFLREKRELFIDFTGMLSSENKDVTNHVVEIEDDA